jgi:hypothetical protein
VTLTALWNFLLGAFDTVHISVRKEKPAAVMLKIFGANLQNVVAQAT